MILDDIPNELEVDPEVLVSEHDILDGMAWSLAGDPHG